MSTPPPSPLVSPRPLFVSQVLPRRHSSSARPCKESEPCDIPALRLPPLTPLALFTQSARLSSPRTPHSHRSSAAAAESPRETPPATPKKVSRNHSFRHSLDQPLQALRSLSAGALSSSDPGVPRHPLESLSTVVSETIDCVSTSGKLLKAASVGDSSSDAELSDETILLSASADGTRLQTIKRTRTRALSRATSGGSTSCGASMQLELDPVTYEPLMRVRSHSSVDELRRRLQTVPEHAPLVRKKTQRRLLGALTYTQITFTADPLAMSEWEIFVIPNSKITLSMHTALSAAHQSEDLDPHRQCQCLAREGKKCTQHALPDTVAKFFGSYMLCEAVERSFDQTVRELIRDYAARKLLGTPGEWKKYKVVEGAATAAEIEKRRALVTHEYKFRIFFWL